VLVSSQASWAQFNGLGGTMSGAMGPDVSGLPGQNGGGPQPNGWNLFLGAGTNYGNQFVAPTTQPEVGGAGTMWQGNLNWGANGFFSNANSLTQVNYSGGYNRAFQTEGLDFLNNTLNVNHTRQLSERTTLLGFAQGGSFNRVVGDTLANRSLNEFATLVLAPQFLDTKTYFAGAGGGFQHRLSERAAVSAVAQYFVVSRPGATLFDPRGISVSGRYSYRLTPRDSVFAGYEVNQNYYRRQVGESLFHQGFAGISHQLSERTVMGIQAGYGIADSTFAEVVPIDPELAEILGQSTTVRLGQSSTQLWTGSAFVRHQRERVILSLAAARSVNPGNGVLALMRLETVAATADFRGTDRINFNLSAQYNRMKGLSGVNNSFSGYQAGTGVSVRILSNISAFARYDRLWTESGQTSFSRNTFVATFGIGWNSRTRPVPLF
jgi:hypothetical protein